MLGVFLFPVVPPFPSWPSPSWPQHFIPPSAHTAHDDSPAAEIEFASNRPFPVVVNGMFVGLPEVSKVEAPLITVELSGVSTLASNPFTSVTIGVAAFEVRVMLVVSEPLLAVPVMV